MRRGNYYLAYQEFLRPGVDAAERNTPEYRTARLAYLLQQGQEAVFNNSEGRAIEYFNQALEMDPGNKVAMAWIDKAKRKLATRATREGDARRTSGELEEALLAYHQALKLVPDFALAKEGVKAVAETVKQKEARAEAHYYKGVEALGKQLFGLAWYHLVNSLEIDPKLEKARERRDSVGDRLNEDRYRSALELEHDGHFVAALQQLEDLARSGAQFDGLADAIDRTKAAVDAGKMIEDAEMHVFRRDYAGARDLLLKARELSGAPSQQEEITHLLVLAQERDLEDRYTSARILELEHKLEEALAAYREIDKMAGDTEGGFKDTRALIKSLESTIEIAREAYERGQKAEAAGNAEAAIQAYEDALLVYPGYKGLDKKVAELRGK